MDRQKHRQYAKYHNRGTFCFMTSLDFGGEILEPGLADWMTRHLDSNLEQLSYIHDYLGQASEHPRSQDLKPNPYPIEEHFAHYPKTGSLIEAMASRGLLAINAGSQPPKTDLLEPDNPNIGWKLHLEVEPKDVIATSEYLHSEAYVFKYLGGFIGGNMPNPGKIFTIYVGSFAKTLDVAPALSEDLAAHLRKPRAVDDIEFAPGVVGRFVADLSRFTYYGPKGIQLLSYDQQMLQEHGIKPPYSALIKRLTELQAIRMLASPEYGYGSYFIDPSLIGAA